ncbi:MAG: cation:proton antiporter [Chloroflexota bacterium]|nr:cation:proton antiporter [Chloroflexota bacterium]MDE2886356.1 cation:proton antiporter [Chloroflexota bacterium]
MIELESALFDDIVVILVAAGAGGLVARLVRLPPIIGYLVAGAVVGPHALGLITHLEDVQTLAEFGVVLLLFAVGVEISLTDLRRLGWRVLVASAGQISLTIAVGYGIGTALGWDARASLVAGMALSLSSTMVALKTLNDRGELGTLHGRMAAGMLLVQDLAFVPMMAVIAALGGEGDSLARELVVSAAKAAGILAVVLFVGSFGLPWLLKRVALVGARESFVVTVMAAALGAAALTSWAGLSAPLGAFVAGLVLSESDWAGRRALSEVIPVRDVFAALFFVSLGMLTDVDFLASHLGEVALFIGASIVVKLFLIHTLTRAVGYLPDTAARTSFLMIQIGEFSFIVAGTAVALGVASEELLLLIITAAVVTMGITPGFVAGASRALTSLRARSTFFERHLAGAAGAEAALARAPALQGHVIVAGYGRVGALIVQDVRRLGLPYIAIESDPAIISREFADDASLIYGDATNDAVLTAAGVQNARLFVAALPEHVSALVAVQHARRLNPQVRIVSRAAWEEEARELEKAGADAVVWPELEAALEMTRLSLLDVGVAKPVVEELVEEARAELGEWASYDESPHDEH